MQGTVVIDAEAGRALRLGAIDVLGAHVLGGIGAFRAGDRVYVVTRGKDGGQGVIATGIVRTDSDQLGHAETEATGVVMRADDLSLLWPPAG